MTAASASCPTSCRASRSRAKPPRSTRRKPKVEGLILHKHGIFTFGDTAREAYERMIELVTLAEERLARNRKAVFVDRATAAADRAARRGRADPARRRAASRTRRSKAPGGGSILDFRADAGDPQFRQRRRACALRPGRRGDARPHHPHQELAADRAGARGRQARRFQARRAEGGRGLRRALQGLFRAQQCARRRHQDHARSAAARRAGAGARPVRPRPQQEGRRASPPTSPRPRSRPSPTRRRSAASSRSRKPTCSTWNTGRSSRPSSAAAEKPLAGQVAVVTGAGGAIGAATAKAFAAAGAEVALLDLDETGGAGARPRRSAAPRSRSAAT